MREGARRGIRGLKLVSDPIPTDGTGRRVHSSSGAFPNERDVAESSNPHGAELLEIG